jgi:hypothetical protein
MSCHIKYRDANLGGEFVCPHNSTSGSGIAVHGTPKDGLSRIAAAKTSKRLTEIVIRESSVKQFRRDLALRVINATTVFPDLDRLSCELTPAVWCRLRRL